MLNDKLWFLHVPKTGGESVRTWLKKNKVKTYGNGHRYYSEEVLSQFESKPKILTILRCPVENTRSMYSYLKKARERKGVKMPSFSDWLRLEKDIGWGAHWHKPATSNLYTLFFSDRDALRKEKKMSYEEYLNVGVADFNKAFESLRSFTYVLDTTVLAKGMRNTLVKDFKGSTFDIKRNTTKKFDVKEEDVEFIRKNRSFDFKICKALNIKSSYYE